MFFRKPVTHEMSLHPGPFERIASGKKTDELRLNDEKRRLLKVGDRIIFSKRPELKEKLAVRVTSITKYKSFADMYEGVKKRYPGVSREEFTANMHAYYAPLDADKWGTLAIGIKVLRPMGPVGLGAFLAVGAFLSFVGMAAGFALGATVFAFPIDYGGLPGYEGSGLFGAVLGIMLVPLLWILLSVRVPEQRRRFVRTYLWMWPALLIGVHLLALANVNWGPLFAPAMFVLAIALAEAKTSFPRRAAALVGICAAGVFVTVVVALRLMSSTPVPIPPASYNPESIIVESREVDESHMKVTASRGDARATVAAYRDGSAAGRLLRTLRLHRRYEVVYELENRRGYAYTSGSSDYWTDQKIPYDQHSADVQLAHELVYKLDGDAELRKRYREELAWMRHHLGWVTAALNGPAAE